VHDLLAALSENLRAEATGTLSQAEVRRRAEPAKALVKAFLKEYSGSAALADSPSYVATVAALRLLAEFYAREGPRARLGGTVAGEAVARALDEAQAALDAELLAAA
jgi:hypothetical protein